MTSAENVVVVLELFPQEIAKYERELEKQKGSFNGLPAGERLDQVRPETGPCL